MAAQSIGLFLCCYWRFPIESHPLTLPLAALHLQVAHRPLLRVLDVLAPREFGAVLVVVVVTGPPEARIRLIGEVTELVALGLQPVVRLPPVPLLVLALQRIGVGTGVGPVGASPVRLVLALARLRALCEVTERVGCGFGGA